MRVGAHCDTIDIGLAGPFRTLMPGPTHYELIDDDDGDSVEITREECREYLEQLRRSTSTTA